MEMSGERLIPAPKQTVWDALNDPEVLKQCIPGCESLERTGEHDLKATASVKIGPIGARFNGKVTLSDLDPPNSYKISGEGQGGVAGFAKGGASVRLADEGTSTRLNYDVSAQVGGKIAQLGARLIDATSKQMADLFFQRFAMVVAPAPAAAETVPDTAPAPVPEAVAAPSPAAGVAVAEAPVAMAARTPAPAPAAPRPASRAPLPPAQLPTLSVWDLIPAEPFGYPRIAVIGFILWLCVFFLVFKSYVGL